MRPTFNLVWSVLLLLFCPLAFVSSSQLDASWGFLSGQLPGADLQPPAQVVYGVALALLTLCGTAGLIIAMLGIN